MSNTVSYEIYEDYMNTWYANNFTTDAYYNTFTNGSGVNSVLGTCVSIKITQPEYQLSSTTDTTRPPVGIVLEDGIANGQGTKVAISGIVYALMEDGVSIAQGSKISRSTVAGRVKQGSEISLSTSSVDFVGYALETVASTTNTLIQIYLPPRT